MLLVLRAVGIEIEQVDHLHLRPLQLSSGGQDPKHRSLPRIRTRTNLGHALSRDSACFLQLRGRESVLVHPPLQARAFSRRPRRNTRLSIEPGHAEVPALDLFMLNILTWQPISVKIALLRYLLRRNGSVLPTPDEALQSLGAAIRAARIARGHTQQSLAKAAKVSRGNLALLEQGGNVSIRYLLKVARVLDLTNIPLGGTVQLTSGNEEGLNVFGLIESLDLIAAVLDHLRRSVMNAVLPASERRELKDTVALKDFVARQLGNSAGAERLAKAIVQLSDDVPAGASPPRVGDVEKSRARSSRRTKGRVG